MSDETEDNVVRPAFRPLVVAKEMPDSPAVYDAAHELLKQWQEGSQTMPRRILFVFDDGQQLAFNHVGEPARPTEMAGLLHGAAHLVLDLM